jgi:hypothetical protein
MESVEKLRTSFAQKLSGLSVAARIAVVVLACVVIGGLVFWLCNELIYFYTARSYTEELADAYDLNSGQSRAILWASFAAIVVLAGYTFSFSKRKRWFGYAGVLTLLIGHSLLLGHIDPSFRKNGVAEKCYVTMLAHRTGDGDKKPITRESTKEAVKTIRAGKAGLHPADLW